jgi:hypothetical protein
MKINYLFAFILLSFSASAQTAREYFFPAQGKNASTYTTEFNDEKKLTKIYVRDYGDSALIATQSNVVVNTNNIARPNAWEQSVKINPLEIVAMRGRAKTANGIEHFDRSGDILFKLPARQAEIAQWENPNQRGTRIEVQRSEFCKVQIDGENRDAVKVTTILKRKTDGKEENFYTEYFVKGIGFYKRTDPTGVYISEILTEQKSDPNFPTLN